jgi:hypothetical protein
MPHTRLIVAVEASYHQGSCHVSFASTSTSSPQESRSTRSPSFKFYINQFLSFGAWPKHETLSPPPKDLPYADMLKNMRKVPKDDGRGEQLEFCGRILSDLQHKQHQTLLRSRSLSVCPTKSNSYLAMNAQ